VAAALRFGLIGLGTEGWQVLPFFDAIPTVRLVAACDVRREALDALRADRPDVHCFASVVELCRDGEIDAVWIATPNEYHAEHTILAARGGKHVILEKPMALSMEEADRMVDEVERSGVQLLMHSHAHDAPIQRTREIVAGGRLGRLIGVHTWSYKGWLRSPRLASELDTSRGGGVVFRQGPHQVEIVRSIGGGLVANVRAYAGRWQPYLQTEGNYTALLEFEDGTPATLVFNGYGHFNITDLTWGIGEGGQKTQAVYEAWQPRTGPVEPAALYAGGGRPRRVGGTRERYQPIFGLTIVSCERGDIRQSPDGLFVYSENGCEEIPCPPYEDRGAELRELSEAVAEGRPVFPDGRWGRATLEVILAILQSSQERRVVPLSRQVSAPM